MSGWWSHSRWCVARSVGQETNDNFALPGTDKLPKWMERATPKVSSEGNEWFAEHETPAEQANALQEKT